MSKKLTLTKTEELAVERRDLNYINSKGADLYSKGEYELAIEYYRLACAMGDPNAISNLGYCYLYGRSIEPNLSLALSYFKIASLMGNHEASYKLGDIYSSDKWGITDKELSIYYYLEAAKDIIGEERDDYRQIPYTTELQKYPSLCFALGRETLPEGYMNTDIESSYAMLKHAEVGYRKEIANGNLMYEKSCESVLDYLSRDIFDGIRAKYDPLYEPDDEEKFEC